MLSYEHKFHAGNSADILKHVALTSILNSLCKKEKPFTIIDSHAGSGRYNLNSQELEKTQEAKNGIIKLMKYHNNPSIPLTNGLKNYLDLQKPYFDNNEYAASPEIERLFARKSDIIHLVEKHPSAVEKLKENCDKLILTKDGETKCQCKTMIYSEDSYKTLEKITPPLVKRGLILIDPSYEDLSDYDNVANIVNICHKKWNTAIIAVWYPLLTKKKFKLSTMLTSLENCGKLGNNPCETFNVELVTRELDDFEEDEKSHMYGSGMFILNPPYMLKEELEKDAKMIEKLLSF